MKSGKSTTRGMYLVKDRKGDHRFICSRKAIDGPTVGTDLTGQGGRSALNGSSSLYWSDKFHAVWRF